MLDGAEPGGYWYMLHHAETFSKPEKTQRGAQKSNIFLLFHFLPAAPSCSTPSCLSTNRGKIHFKTLSYWGWGIKHLLLIFKDIF